MIEVSEERKNVQEESGRMKRRGITDKLEAQACKEELSECGLREVEESWK